MLDAGEHQVDLAHQLVGETGHELVMGHVASGPKWTWPAADTTASTLPILA